MNNVFTAEELIVFAKMLAIMLGEQNITFTDSDEAIACELLKKMADNSPRLTCSQKQEYKFLVDFCKENSKKYR